MLRQYAAAGSLSGLLGETRRAQEEISRLLGDLRFAPTAEFPPLNVWAGTDGAIVTAEIPGVSPDQIEITVHQHTVTLRGKRDPEAAGNDIVVRLQERAHGPFARTVVLPFRIDADKVSARFDRGTLLLELPRPASDRPRTIQVTRA